MLRAALIVATVCSVGCPSHGPASYPTIVDNVPLRIRVAHAEAKRAAGVGQLTDLLAHGDLLAKELALRGLGRIGGTEALAVIKGALADPDPTVATAAFAAIGVMASLDDLAPLDGEVTIPTTLHDPQLAVVLEAFGRAGGASQQAAIISAVERKTPSVVAQAALALGRMARRKLTYPAATRAWLITQTAASDRDVRYAATYALSREVIDPGLESKAAIAALAARIADADPEIRATAIAGLAKRAKTWPQNLGVEDALRDRDWRVAVEAVRALAGDKGDAASRELVATNLERRWHELQQGRGGEAHVIGESLRLIIAHPELGPAGVAALASFTAHVTGGTASHEVSPLAGPWLERLTAIANAAVTKHLSIDLFVQGALPEYLRVALAADVVEQGDATFRRAAMRLMLEHADARVRAAGLGELAKVGPDAIDHALAVTTVGGALASPDPIIAGSAIDAAGEVYTRVADEPALRNQLDAAIVARATRELDVELSSDLISLIAKQKIAAGADACRAGLAGHPVRAHAAAECLKALGQAVPAPAIAAATPPPVDVATVIGKRVTWHVATTTGEVVIELRPDLAPWNVATIVALTRRGFYDGLAFHRVVPDFVVQGGDPTSSGYGGPGFTVPAEPSAYGEGGFEEGGIGIADAGRDSGGSQWFAMHSRAPHLDGRYTYIGKVTSGGNSASSLLIGDKVVKATVEVR